MTDKSSTFVELAKALNKFQGAISSVAKTSSNPFFHSKYADLDAVWEMCRKPLADNGLALVQATVCENEKLYLETLLLHTSGEYLSSRYPLTPMHQVQGKGWELSSDPQSLGSAITYARRYAMSAMLGVSADEDDDAEKSMARDEQRAGALPSATEQPTPKDNRYWCAEHKTEWFKRGKMKSYGHPKGDKEPWCYMKEARLDAKDNRDQPMKPSPEAQVPPEPAAVPSGERVFADLGALYMWSATIGFPTVKSRMDVPGVNEAIETKDYPKAAQLLEAAKAK